MERLINPNDNNKNVHITNDMDIFIEKLKSPPRAGARPVAIAGYSVVCWGSCKC